MDSPASTANVKTPALLFINMGGPRSVNDVGRFMYNLFNDVHIVDISQPFRSLIARMICMARVGNVKKSYQQIGGKSPIFKWTQSQADKTALQLRGKYPNIFCTDGYSYTRPFIDEAIGQLLNNNPDQIIVVPLYPYYSLATLGGMYSDIEKARLKYGLNDILSRPVSCSNFADESIPPPGNLLPPSLNGRQPPTLPTCVLKLSLTHFNNHLDTCLLAFLVCFSLRATMRR